MRYQMNFGSLGKSITELKPTGTDRFRIALLGDFSGRANKGELAIGDALASRKPLKVDVDNIDDVIGRLNIEIDLPLGGDEGATRIEISSIDDFHPDELYDNLEIFEELAGLRQRLNNSGTFDGAASEVMSWLDDDSIRKPKKIKAKSRGTAIPSEGKLSDFAQLVVGPRRKTAKIRSWRIFSSTWSDHTSCLRTIRVRRRWSPRLMRHCRD